MNDSTINKKQDNNNQIFSTCTSLIESQIVLPQENILTVHQSNLLYRYFRLMREHFYLHLIEIFISEVSDKESKYWKIFMKSILIEERKQHLRRYYPMQHTIKRIKNSITARIATDKMKPYTFKPQLKLVAKVQVNLMNKTKIQTKKSDRHMQPVLSAKLMTKKLPQKQQQIKTKRSKIVSIIDKKSPKKEIERAEQYGIVKFMGVQYKKPLLKQKQVYQPKRNFQATKNLKENESNYYLASIKQVNLNVKNHVGSPEASSKHSRKSSSSKLLTKYKSRPKLENQKSEKPLPTRR